MKMILLALLLISPITAYADPSPGLVGPYEVLDCASIVQPGASMRVARYNPADPKYYHVAVVTGTQVLKKVLELGTLVVASPAQAPYASFPVTREAYLAYPNVTGKPYIEFRRGELRIKREGAEIRARLDFFLPVPSGEKRTGYDLLTCRILRQGRRP